MSDQKPDEFAELREAFENYKAGNCGSADRLSNQAIIAMPALLDAVAERDKTVDRVEYLEAYSDSILEELPKLVTRAERAEAEAKALREAAGKMLKRLDSFTTIGYFTNPDWSAARAVLEWLDAPSDILHQWSGSIIATDLRMDSDLDIAERNLAEMHRKDAAIKRLRLALAACPQDDGDQVNPPQVGPVRP